MACKRLSKFLFALFGAVMLTASSADAHSGHASSFTLSDYSVNAYANVTSSSTSGPYEITDTTIDLEAGVRLAHGDGTSEITPPADEEQIGTGTVKARWVFFFCAASTLNATATWETDMTGAPAGAVGHIELAVSVGTSDLWIIEENDATDDYKLYSDLDDSLTCANPPSDSGSSLTMNGTTASGGHPYRNPAASGCYTGTSTSHDTAGGTHTASTDVAIGTGPCP